MLTKKSSVEYWFSCAKMLMHTLKDLFEYYQCTVHTFLKSNTNHLKNSPLKWHIFILMRMIYGNIPYWCKNCIILFSRHHEQKIKAGLGAVPQNGDLRRIFQPVTTHSKWLLQGNLPKKFFLFKQAVFNHWLSYFQSVDRSIEQLMNSNRLYNFEHKAFMLLFWFIRLHINIQIYNVTNLLLHVFLYSDQKTA